MKSHKILAFNFIFFFQYVRKGNFSKQLFGLSESHKERNITHREKKKT